jgi:hypothetical protein
MIIGNYFNIFCTDQKDTYGHKLYSATCKTCGKNIIKNMSDLRRMSLKCTHSTRQNDANSTRRTLVYGVGINDMDVGWIGQSETNSRIYYLWKAMLLRTTQKFWDEYPTYEGTTACDEWKYLSIFYTEIQECDGYDFWLNNPRQGIMLDKDTKIEGNKCYNKDSCCFISRADSNRDVHKRHPEVQLNAAKACGAKYGKPIKAIEIATGEIKQFSSRKEAARELGILTSHIWMILSDNPKYVSHKSAKAPDGKCWTFEKI